MGERFHFSAAGRRCLEAFIASAIADAVPVPDKPAPAWVADEVEAMIGRLPLLQRTGFAALLRVLEMGPVISGRRRTFTRLSAAEQEKFLRDYEASERYVQRALILFLKTPMLLCYFSHPAVEAAIGYDHSCLVKH